MKSYLHEKYALFEGDGRNLFFIEDESLDAIITDHPYDIKKSNNGGDRHFATYSCFRYSQEDFYEKARVLKKGGFLVEFLPEENGDNWEYLTEIKQMAKKAGLIYYSKVPWVKDGFVSNCGRKSKNTEDVLFFTKGKARNLRINAKKCKNNPGQTYYMSGTSRMLPTSFVFAKSKNMIHQAEKPVKLLEEIISYVSLPGETILDQFAGSGVLAEACLNTNRKSILIEIDENFTQKIIERLSN